MHSSQEISSSNPLLSTQSSTEISQDLKEQFYQSFLEMNEQVMAQLIEVYGLKVVYSDFDYSDEYIEDIKITHTDPISRMAFVCNKQERFSFESCQFFLKLLDHKQRIEIIESINLHAFLDAAYIKYSSQVDIHIHKNLEFIAEAEYLENHAEKDDFKKHFIQKALSEYLDRENLTCNNPLYNSKIHCWAWTAAMLFGSLQNLFALEDVAKILTASDPLIPDSNFFFNDIIESIHDQEEFPAFTFPLFNGYS